jgi:non-ribosomal peptide synthetase component E (peptide arylation enzyme)
LIFIDDDPALLKQDADFDNMSDAERSAFLTEVDYTLTGFNLGRDRQIVVLFSYDVSYVTGSTIKIGTNNYTINTKIGKDKIAVGSWMALRTYLQENGEIMSVSPPGNVVLIDP